MSLPPLSDEEAADIALSLAPFERAVIAHFAKGKAWQYTTIAERIGVSYSVVQSVAHKLRHKLLGHISVIPYDGSRFFLNERGESVKRAVAILERIEGGHANHAGLQDI